MGPDRVRMFSSDADDVERRVLLVVDDRGVRARVEQHERGDAAGESSSSIPGGA